MWCLVGRAYRLFFFLLTLSMMTACLGPGLTVPGAPGTGGIGSMSGDQAPLVNNGAGYVDDVVAGSANLSVRPKQTIQYQGVAY